MVSIRLAARVVVMRKWLTRALVLSLLLAAALAAGRFYLDWQMKQPLALPQEGLDYELSQGTSFIAMTNDLARRGVLAQPRLLQLHARLRGDAAQIKAGEYRLQPGMTPDQLLAMMRQGRVLRYRVTLPEGWTIRQAIEHLRQQPKLRSELQLGQPLWPQLGVDDPLADHPEGQFFPDTYDYVRGDSDADILRRAHRRLKNILQQEWAQRAPGLPLGSPYQALILASIVERETGVPTEREAIAGVFVRRLLRNMRLQTDPTVIYGLGDAYQQNLTTRHLRDAGNRYNTYRHAGLPPTPIALPGREAIHAALHPAPGEALYFVAKGDGSHYFSATLAEHQRAVRQYQIYGRRSDYRSAPPSSDKYSNNDSED